MRNSRINLKLGLLSFAFCFTVLLVAKSNQASAIDEVPTSINSVVWKSSDESITNNIIEPPQNIIVVNFQYDETLEDKLSISDVLAQTGYYPKVNLRSEGYHVTIKDLYGKNLYYNSLIIPKLPELPTPNSNISFTINLPYLSTASTLEIYNPKGYIVGKKDISNLKVTSVTPKFSSIRGNELQKGGVGSMEYSKLPNTDFLDITFIGDDYTDAEMSQFQSDATRIANGILQIEPFKTRSSQIRFHTVNNTVDLGCGYDAVITRLIMCDSTSVISQLNHNGAIYDKVVVIYKNNQYGGGAYIDWIISTTYNGGSAARIAPHELGHNLGLMDEYSYGSNPAYYIPDRNCYDVSGPNPKWEGIVGSQDYALTCSSPNWYRPSKSSLMNDMTDYFNLISLNHVNKEMDLYGGTFLSTLEVPTVTITCPQNGYIDRKDITLCLNYSNYNPVLGVDVFIDGKLWTTLYSGTIYYTLDGSNLTDGLHTIEIRAFDGLNRKGQSGKVTVDIRNKVPFGFIESINEGKVKGWAIDSDSTWSSVQLEFYQDGPKGQGVYMGSTVANVYREDIEEPGNHGFLWTIPSQFRDGRQHTVWAYALDSSGDVANHRHLYNQLNTYQLTNKTWDIKVASRCGFETTRVVYNLAPDVQTSFWNGDNFSQGSHNMNISPKSLTGKTYLVLVSISSDFLQPISSNPAIQISQRPIYNFVGIPNGTYKYVAEIDNNLLSSGTYTIDFQPYTNCTRTWTLRVQSTCSNTPVSSSFAVWPPSPLVWNTDSYAAGTHTVTITSNSPTSYIYLRLKDSIGSLTPTGTKPHYAMEYGAYLSPVTPMARWNSLDLPAGAYSIYYQDRNTYCKSTKALEIAPIIEPISTSIVIDRKRQMWT
jgi:hypothetical protein